MPTRSARCHWQLSRREIVTIQSPFDEGGCRRLAQRLSSAGLPVTISDDAGQYVCNHLYHAALDGPCGADGPQALFVHLPAIAGTPLAASAAASMSLAAMEQALALIVKFLAE